MRDWKRYVKEQLPPLGLRPERESEIVEELAQQLEQAYQSALTSGAAPEDAEARAVRQVGDWDELARSIRTAERPEQPAEILGAPTGSSRLAGVAGDLRYALRMFARNPGFAAAAILTLALGIGGCVAIYSLLDAVVLRSLEYRDPERLVMVWERNYALDKKENVISPANYLDWKARNHVFALMSVVGDWRANVTGMGDPETVKADFVGPEFLEVLGVQPLLGRPFGQQDAKRGAPPVALIGHRFWMNKFGGNAEAIGKSLTVDGEATTIAGILPAGFRSIGFEPDLLVPMGLDPARDYRNTTGRYLKSVARIRPGFSLEQARREMSALARDLEREYPKFNKGWGVTLTPMQRHFSGRARAGLWLLMGAVALVLLIACLNVANLLLVRASGREREMAIRGALGARRGRILRQLLSESVLLAGFGGLLGCGVAFFLVRALKAIAPVEVPRLESAGVDAAALAFSLALTLATGVLFGLAPALAAARTSLAHGLRESGRAASGGVRGRRLRSILVAAQIALSCVLLVGAGLLLRSFARLLSTDPGFVTGSVLTMHISMSGTTRSQPGAMVRLFNDLTEEARRMPGVESASAITFLPFAGLGSATSFFPEGQPEKEGGEAPVTDVRMVEPHFFETMKIPLKAGRLFTDADNQTSAPIRLVISETMAHDAFPGQSALGRKLKVSMGDESMKGCEVIGIVSDIRLNSLSGTMRPMVYYPMAKMAYGMATLVIRSAAGDPMLLARPMLGKIREKYPDQPVSDVKPMTEWVSDSLKQQRFLALLLSGLAGLSLLLAAVGLYGVLSYAVAQRTREIGVRLALGADPNHVRWQVIGSGMQLTAFGLFAGLALATLLSRLLDPVLEGMAPADPLSYAASLAILALVSVLATSIPAHRATKVDPVVALREE